MTYGPLCARASTDRPNGRECSRDAILFSIIDDLEAAAAFLKTNVNRDFMGGNCHL